VARQIELAVELAAGELEQTAKRLRETAASLTGSSGERSPAEAVSDALHELANGHLHASLRVRSAVNELAASLTTR
jgi:muramidase (phage lysozyme)